jgi:hypothetical protein
MSIEGCGQPRDLKSRRRIETFGAAHCREFFEREVRFCLVQQSTHILN